MKRFISLLLVCTLAIGILTACGPKQKDNEGKLGDKPGTNETITDEKTGSEPVTISMVKKDASPEDEIFIKWQKQINEKLLGAGVGAQVDLVSLQSGTYSENLALMLNSGTIPDIIYFQGGDEEFALTQGILEDLTDYVKNSKHIKDVMKDYMYTRLENYPYLIYLAVLSTKLPVIRTDVFDSCSTQEALLANPSVDNYYALFKELVEDKGFSIAWTPVENLTEIDNTFDQAFNVTSTWVKDSDGKYIFSRISQYELEKLKFYAKLYKEKLLDNEYLTTGWEEKENKFFGNRTGIVSATQGSVVNSYNKKQIAANGEGAYLTILPPAKGISQGYTPVDTSKESRGFAISAVSKHKNLAFDILDWAASPEARVHDILGFEDVHYKVENGMYTKLDPPYSWHSVFHGTLDNFDNSKMNPETPHFSEPALKSLDTFSQYSTQDNAFVIPDEHAISWDACLSVYSEFAAEFVIGNKTEADWDAYVQNWYKAGGDKLTEYANKVIK